MFLGVRPRGLRFVERAAVGVYVDVVRHAFVGRAAAEMFIPILPAGRRHDAPVAEGPDRRRMTGAPMLSMKNGDLRPSRVRPDDLLELLLRIDMAPLVRPIRLVPPLVVPRCRRTGAESTSLNAELGDVPRAARPWRQSWAT